MRFAIRRPSSASISRRSPGTGPRYRGDIGEISVGVAQVRAHPLLDLLDGHALALGVVGDLVLAQLARLQVRVRLRVRVRGLGLGLGSEG